MSEKNIYKNPADLFAVTQKDISAFMRRMQEYQLEMETQGREAQTSCDSQKQFIAHISHEIRTPLNAIIGLSILLGRTPLDEMQQKFLSTLRSSADSLLVLVNDLLDLTKMENNHIQLEKRKFELYPLVQEILDMIRATAIDKDLDIRLEYGEYMPARVIGDSYRIRQILLNLLSNAVKFTDTGSVTLRLEPVWRDDEHIDLKICVIDTGMGIPPDKIAAIFESFTQADPSTARKYGGTGLGLSITRRLVEVMQGDIRVASHPGRGSTFSLRIPLGVDRAPVDGGG